MTEEATPRKQKDPYVATRVTPWVHAQAGIFTLDDAVEASGGARPSVASILNRMTTAGDITRVGRGVYRRSTAAKQPPGAKIAANTAAAPGDSQPDREQLLIVKIVARQDKGTLVRDSTGKLFVLTEFTL